MITRYGRGLFLATFVLCGPGRLLADEPAVLTHGPVLGDVGPEQIRVWIRTDQQAPVQIEYSRWDDLTDSTLTAAVQEVLGSPGYREAARRAGAGVADVADPVRVCHAALGAPA